MKNSGHYFETQERKMKRRFFGLDNLSDRERSQMIFSSLTPAWNDFFISDPCLKSFFYFRNSIPGIRNVSSLYLFFCISLCFFLAQSNKPFGRTQLKLWAQSTTNLKSFTKWAKQINSFGRKERSCWPTKQHLRCFSELWRFRRDCRRRCRIVGEMEIMDHVNKV